MKRIKKSNSEKMIHENSHLLPVLAEGIREMLYPAYHVELLMNNREFRWNLFELAAAIEIINICQGKRTGNEFIKAFKLCIPDDILTMKDYLRHLATLLYMDKRNKLFRAVIENPNFPDIDSKEVIFLAKRAITKERKASPNRSDSDAVKIKGAIKKAKIISLERKALSWSGSNYIVEEAFKSEKEIYQQIFHKNLIENLRKEIQQYVEEQNRKDRAKNILKYIDYIFETKEVNPSVSRVARDLNLSRKAIYQIRKPLQEDIRFRRLIDALLKK